MSDSVEQRTIWVSNLILPGGWVVPSRYSFIRLDDPFSGPLIGKAASWTGKLYVIRRWTENTVWLDFAD